MFSGKSSKLISLYNEKKDSKQILLINYKDDVRYGENMIITHTKQKVICHSCLYLKDIIQKSLFLEADIIMIDEAQFFPDLLEFVIKSVESFHKEVYVAGLDGDYNRNIFGDIVKLIPLADMIIKLKAKCNCNGCSNDAIFSKRIVKNDDKILIGGIDSYVPVCRKHYLI